MRNILKSYVKSYFKNWIEAFGSLIFVLLIFVVVIGISAAPSSFNDKYRMLENNSHLWDANVQADPATFDAYDVAYFFNEHATPPGKPAPYHDLLVPTTPLLNMQAMIDIGNGTSVSLSEYLKTAFDEAKHGNVNLDWYSYIGMFLADNFLSTHHGHITLPGCSLAGGKLIDISNFTDLINGEWIKTYEQFHNQVYLALESRLIGEINKTTFDYSMSVYHPYKKSFFYFNDINQNKSDNVVLLDKQSRMPVVGHHEALISDLYARAHHIKLGDTITTDDVKYQGDNAHWKIVGFANRLSDLFPVDSFNQLLNNINDYAVIYLTGQDMSSYISGFYNVDNGFKAGDYKLYLSQRLMFNDPSYSMAQFRIDFKHYASSFYLTSFNDLNMVVGIKMISVQVLIFGLVGIVLLFLAFAFINFIVKKEIRQIARQIGLFKAYGYRNSQLSWIFSGKTYVTILLGAILGYVISMPLQAFVHDVFAKTINIYLSPYLINPVYLCILFIVIPIFFTAISYLITMLYLKVSPVMLISSGEMRPNRSRRFSLFLLKLGARTSFPNRLRMAYMVRGWSKAMVIFILFFIVSVLMILEFDGTVVIRNMSDNVNGLYQPDFDHYYTLPIPEQYINGDGTISFTTFGTWQQKFFTYHKPSDIIAQANKANPFPLNEDPSFKAYLACHVTGKGDCTALLTQMATYTDFNHSAMHYSTFKTLLNDIILDMHGLEPFTSYLKSIITMYDTFTDWQKNDFVITINNVFRQAEMESYALKLLGDSDPTEKLATERLSMNLISDNMHDFMQFKGVTYSQYYRSIYWKNNNGPISIVPVIVSNRFSVINHLHINDTFNYVQYDHVKAPHNYKCQIVGIISNGNFDDENIYTGYDSFKHNFFDKSINNLIYNELYSNQKLLIKKIDLMHINEIKSNMKVHSDYFSLNIQPLSGRDTVTLAAIIKDGLAIHNQIGIPLIGDTKVTLMALQRAMIEQGISSINTAFMVFEVIDAFVLFVVLFVLTSAIVQETMNFILVLKTFGYRNSEINFTVIGNYLLCGFVAFVVAYCVVLLLWHFVLAYIFTSTSLLIAMPWNWQSPVIVFLIILIVLSAAWAACLKAIVRKDITNLDVM